VDGPVDVPGRDNEACWFARGCVLGPGELESFDATEVLARTCVLVTSGGRPFEIERILDLVEALVRSAQEITHLLRSRRRERGLRTPIGITALAELVGS
jgi:hypothetical protein